MGMRLEVTNGHAAGGYEWARKWTSRVGTVLEISSGHFLEVTISTVLE